AFFLSHKTARISNSLSVGFEIFVFIILTIYFVKQCMNYFVTTLTIYPIFFKWRFTFYCSHIIEVV
ncbi:MAG: hypothetical protein ABIO04_05770, partial [Ferruginibacter sp.]